MTVLEAALLGVVQGLTEFLPVSSDGHLSLMNYFLGTSRVGANNLFFTVLLHLGTLVSVFIVFWRSILGLIKEFFLLMADLFTGRFRMKNCTETRRLLIMLLVSLLPVFLILPFKNTIERISSDADIVAEGICFLFNGAVLLLASKLNKGTRTAGDMHAKDSLLAGFFQALAALPGVSRSGTTISVGLMRGFSCGTAVEFSFLMGIPAILGANLLEISDAVKSRVAFDLFPSLVGIAAAAIVGLFAIRALKWLVRKQKLSVFGWYCLALGLISVFAGLTARLSHF